MSQSSFVSKYSRLANLAESWLIDKANQEDDGSKLAQAMSYSLLAPGKRFRPVLSLLCAEVCSVELRAIAPFSIALEYIHAASLIHDDLPAIDNDELRRGQPTCHIAYGESTAILAGDALFVRAFAIVQEAKDIPESVRLRLIGLLTAAFSKLCSGQMMDLESGAAHGPCQLSLLEQDPEKALLRKRHLFKTGALIAAAAVGPSYLAKAAVQEMAAQPLLRFAHRIGLLFQITDDILDVTSSADDLGKNPSADQRQGTSTYVSLYGLDGAKALASTTAEEAQDALEPFGAKAKDLRSLVAWVRDRKN